MKKKSFIYILLLTSLALAGMVITQLFWVRNAMDQRSEVFNHRARISLERVVDNLLFMSRNATADNEGDDHDDCRMSCRLEHDPISKVISPTQLDSLISLQFPDLEAGEDYFYGVYGKKNERIIMGKAGDYKKELVASQLSASLTCLFRPETFMLSIYFPNQKAVILSNMWLWMIFSLSLIIAMVIGFTMSVYSLLHQKKVSEMKTDFLNSMTHEFKTPIATISIASEMLQNPAVLGSSEKSFRYAEIIQTENERLKKQVEQVLQMAVIDKGEFTLRRRRIEVHKILEGLTRSFQLIVKQRKGVIVTDFQSKDPEIFADKEHITNVFANLIDNAEKYSHCAPHITIRTRDVKGGLMISVEDKGIGIKPESQKEIFRKLFRANSGSMPDVTGFGLGLFYAKTVVYAHGGTISLESVPKKGSKFSIFFPNNLQDFDKQEHEEQISEDLAG